MEDDVTREIDDQANALIDEFKQHVTEVQAQYPDATDKGLIYEGWAIQKIAGLQVLVLSLAERIAELEGAKIQRN